MQSLFRMILALWGWKISGHLPADKKYVVIVAPHTSNWDLAVGLVARLAIGVRMEFLAKQQIFVFPFGGIIKYLGGIPIDRTKSHNVVDQIAEQFKQTDTLRLAITPEGTRKPVKRWKEGFYYIAYKAQVPIVMIGFDYAKKVVRIGEHFMPSGDIAQDFKHIVAFFRTIHGCYPKDIPDYQPK